MSEQNNNSQRLTGFRAFIPFYILYDLDLDGHHFRFYGQIEQMESNPDPRINPDFSYSWMAKQLGIKKRHAINIANLLREKGYIEHVQIAKGRWRWNTVKKPIIQCESDLNEDLGGALPEHYPGALPEHYPGALAVHPKSFEVKSFEVKSQNLKDIADSSNTAKTSKAISWPKNYKDCERFMTFYDSYPRHQDPGDAYKAFKQVVGLDDDLLAIILGDIALRKEKHSQWRDKQFIKYPAVYLRKGEYLGEIINDEAEKQKKMDEQKRIADERLKAQEEASQRRAAAELANNHAKQADAIVYRETTAKALADIKKSLGM